MRAATPSAHAGPDAGRLESESRALGMPARAHRAAVSWRSGVSKGGLIGSMGISAEAGVHQRIAMAGVCSSSGFTSTQELS